MCCTINSSLHEDDPCRRHLDVVSLVYRGTPGTSVGQGHLLSRTTGPCGEFLFLGVHSRSEDQPRLRSRGKNTDFRSQTRSRSIICIKCVSHAGPIAAYSTDRYMCYLARDDGSVHTTTS